MDACEQAVSPLIFIKLALQGAPSSGEKSHIWATSLEIYSSHFGNRRSPRLEILPRYSRLHLASGPGGPRCQGGQTSARQS